MELTLGGNKYQLEFGLEFIATLDKMYVQKSDGMEFGLGVESVIPYIKMENPVVLINIIKAGTAHLKSFPTNQDIKEFLTEKAENDKLSEFFAEVEDAMRVAPFLKGKLKKVEDEVIRQENLRLVDNQ